MTKIDEVIQMIETSRSINGRLKLSEDQKIIVGEALLRCTVSTSLKVIGNLTITEKTGIGYINKAIQKRGYVGCDLQSLMKHSKKEAPSTSLLSILENYFDPNCTSRVMDDIMEGFYDKLQIAQDNLRETVHGAFLNLHVTLENLEVEAIEKAKLLKDKTKAKLDSKVEEYMLNESAILEKINFLQKESLAKLEQRVKELEAKKHAG